MPEVETDVVVKSCASSVLAEPKIDAPQVKDEVGEEPKLYPSSVAPGEIKDEETKREPLMQDKAEELKFNEDNVERDPVDGSMIRYPDNNRDQNQESDSKKDASPIETTEHDQKPGSAKFEEKDEEIDKANKTNMEGQMTSQVQAHEVVSTPDILNDTNVQTEEIMTSSETQGQMAPAKTEFKASDEKSDIQNTDLEKESGSTSKTGDDNRENKVGSEGGHISLNHNKIGDKGDNSLSQKASDNAAHEPLAADKESIEKPEKTILDQKNDDLSQGMKEAEGDTKAEGEQAVQEPEPKDDSSQAEMLRAEPEVKKDAGYVHNISEEKSDSVDSGEKKNGKDTGVTEVYSTATSEKENKVLDISEKLDTIGKVTEPEKVSDTDTHETLTSKQSDVQNSCPPDEDQIADIRIEGITQASSESHLSQDSIISSSMVAATLLRKDEISLGDTSDDDSLCIQTMAEHNDEDEDRIDEDAGEALADSGDGAIIKVLSKGSKEKDSDAIKAETIDDKKRESSAVDENVKVDAKIDLVENGNRESSQGNISFKGDNYDRPETPSVIRDEKDYEEIRSPMEDKRDIPETVNKGILQTPSPKRDDESVSDSVYQKEDNKDVLATMSPKGDKKDTAEIASLKEENTFIQETVPQKGDNTNDQETVPQKGDSTNVQETVPQKGDSTNDQETVPQKGDSTNIQETVPQKGDSTNDQETVPQKGDSTNVQETVPQKGDSTNVQETSSQKIESTSAPETDRQKEDSTNVQETFSPKIESTNVPETVLQEEDNTNVQETFSPKTESTYAQETVSRESDKVNVQETVTTMTVSTKVQETVSRKEESTNVHEAASGKGDSTTVHENVSQNGISTYVQEIILKNEDSTGDQEVVPQKVDSANVPETISQKGYSTNIQETFSQKTDSSNVQETVREKEDNTNVQAIFSSKTESTHVQETVSPKTDEVNFQQTVTTTTTGSTNVHETASEKGDSTTVHVNVSQNGDSTYVQETVLKKVDSISNQEAVPQKGDNINVQETVLQKEGSTHVQEETFSLKTESTNVQETVLQKEGSTHVQETVLQKEDNTNVQETVLQKEENTNVQETVLQNEDNTNVQETVLQKEDNTNVQGTVLQKEDNTNVQETVLQKEDNTNVQETVLQKEDNTNVQETVLQKENNTNVQESFPPKIESTYVKETVTKTTTNSTHVHEAASEKGDSTYILETVSQKEDSKSDPQTVSKARESINIQETVLQKEDSTSNAETLSLSGDSANLQETVLPKTDSTNVQETISQKGDYTRDPETLSVSGESTNVQETMSKKGGNEDIPETKSVDADNQVSSASVSVMTFKKDGPESASDNGDKGDNVDTASGKRDNKDEPDAGSVVEDTKTSSEAIPTQEIAKGLAQSVSMTVTTKHDSESVLAREEKIDDIGQEKTSISRTTAEEVDSSVGRRGDSSEKSSTEPITKTEKSSVVVAHSEHAAVGAAGVENVSHQPLSGRDTALEGEGIDVNKDATVSKHSVPFEGTSIDKHLTGTTHEVYFSTASSAGKSESDSTGLLNSGLADMRSDGLQFDASSGTVGNEVREEMSERKNSENDVIIYRTFALSKTSASLLAESAAEQTAEGHQAARSIDTGVQEETGEGVVKESRLWETRGDVLNYEMDEKHEVNIKEKARGTESKPERQDEQKNEMGSIQADAESFKMIDPSTEKVTSISDTQDHIPMRTADSDISGDFRTTVGDSQTTQDKSAKTANDNMPDEPLGTDTKYKLDAQLEETSLKNVDTIQNQETYSVEVSNVYSSEIVSTKNIVKDEKFEMEQSSSTKPESSDGAKETEKKGITRDDAVKTSSVELSLTSQGHVSSEGGGNDTSDDVMNEMVDDKDVTMSRSATVTRQSSEASSTGTDTVGFGNSFNVEPRSDRKTSENVQDVEETTESLSITTQHVFNAERSQGMPTVSGQINKDLEASKITNESENPQVTETTKVDTISEINKDESQLDIKSQAETVKSKVEDESVASFEKEQIVSKPNDQADSPKELHSAVSLEVKTSQNGDPYVDMTGISQDGSMSRLEHEQASAIVSKVMNEQGFAFHPPQSVEEANDSGKEDTIRETKHTVLTEAEPDLKEDRVYETKTITHTESSGPGNSVVVVHSEVNESSLNGESLGKVTRVTTSSSEGFESRVNFNVASESFETAEDMGSRESLTSQQERSFSSSFASGDEKTSKKIPSLESSPGRFEAVRTKTVAETVSGEGPIYVTTYQESHSARQFTHPGKTSLAKSDAADDVLTISFSGGSSNVEVTTSKYDVERSEERSSSTSVTNSSQARPIASQKSDEM